MGFWFSNADFCNTETLIESVLFLKDNRKTYKFYKEKSGYYLAEDDQKFITTF